MENTKTTKKINWLTIVLAVMVLGLVGYITYDKAFANTDKSSTGSLKFEDKSTGSVLHDLDNNKAAVSTMVDDVKFEDNITIEDVITKEINNSENPALYAAFLSNTCYQDALMGAEEIIEWDVELVGREGDTNIVSLKDLDNYNNKNINIIPQVLRSFITKQARRYGLGDANSDYITLKVSSTALSDLLSFLYGRGVMLNGFDSTEYPDKVLNALYKADKYGVQYYVRFDRDLPGLRSYGTRLRNIKITEDDNNYYVVANYYGTSLSPDLGKVKITIGKMSEFEISTGTSCNVKNIELVK